MTILVPIQVLEANAHHSMSHVSPEFVAVFRDCLRMTREVLFTTGQPFLIAGSGTLGWDQVRFSFPKSSVIDTRGSRSSISTTGGC